MDLVTQNWVSYNLYKYIKIHGLDITEAIVANCKPNFTKYYTYKNVIQLHKFCSYKYIIVEKSFYLKTSTI